MCKQIKKSGKNTHKRYVRAEDGMQVWRVAADKFSVSNGPQTGGGPQV